MKVLVVGASGFIGRNLLLGVARSWDVYGTCRNPVDFSRFLSAYGLDHVRPLQLDLRDAATVEKALASISRPDACVFLASDTAVRALVSDPRLDVTNNILTVANFLKSYRGGKVLFMSSGAVYMGLEGLVSPTARLRPTIPYAISKYASELYVQFAAERGWAEGYVILRFFGAYGPFEPPRKITTKLVQSALARAREFTIFGDGRNLIDVMHIDDAVAGLVAVLQSDRINLTVDFCAGNAFDLNGSSPDDRREERSPLRPGKGPSPQPPNGIDAIKPGLTRLSPTERLCGRGRSLSRLARPPTETRRRSVSTPLASLTSRADSLILAEPRRIRAMR